jgi:hypothetical protein
MGVQDYYKNLGWTQAHWDGTATDMPYTEARWWGMLTDNEKKAANGICYFEDNWDKNDMNPNPTFFPHPPPLFRYRTWDDLDSVTKFVASGMMNYTEDLWNDLGDAVVEKNTFLNLHSTEREGALDLGFYTHTWDCFMNHYLSYYWSSFHGDLKVAVETLGWTEALWESDDEGPATESKMWVDLTPEERAAATRLCWFKEIWDGEPIQKWYDYEKEENTAARGDGPAPTDIQLDIFEETGYAGKEPGRVGTTMYTSADLGQTSAGSVGAWAGAALAATVGGLLLLF